MKKLALFSSGLSLGLLAVLQTSSLGQGPNPLGGLEGKPAPKFSMKSTTGKTLNNNNLKGKVVLLDFWATWCGPCKAASPTMQALHTKYAKQGLVVVGANTLDGTDGKQKAISYAAEHKYTYTFTYGNDDFTRQLGIRGIPAFIFIGKDGKVAKAMIGFGEQMAPMMDETAKTLLAAKGSNSSKRTHP